MKEHSGGFDWGQDGCDSPHSFPTAERERERESYEVFETREKEVVLMLI